MADVIHSGINRSPERLKTRRRPSLPTRRKRLSSLKITLFQYRVSRYLLARAQAILLLFLCMLRWTDRHGLLARSPRVASMRRIVITLTRYSLAVTDAGLNRSLRCSRMMTRLSRGDNILGLPDLKWKTIFIINEINELPYYSIRSTLPNRITPPFFNSKLTR